MKPLLKYCGNHSYEDLLLAINSRANYIGVVFAKSKRQVEVIQLSKWLKQLNWPCDKKLVGLFVNEDIEQIINVTKTVPLHIVQCHGNESVDYIKKLSQKITLPIWKVIHHQENAWEKMDEYAPYVEGFVIDSKAKNAWGGTGISFDWSHIPKYLENGKQLKRTVFIAGGINPTNVEQLLKYSPSGIDLSSGIEEDGKKSAIKMAQLEERIENYDTTT